MELTKVQRFALDAVKRHFSATWQSGEGPPDAYMRLSGRRVAIDIAVMPRQPLGGNPIARARFRDDGVARRVLRNLETAVSEHVPDGQTVVLTLGAPIIEPNKLLGVLTKTLLNGLQDGAEDIEKKKTLLGNRVRFLIASGGLRLNSKFTGFVFSGDPEPGVLLNAMRSLQGVIAARARKRLPVKFSGDRWLVLVSEQWLADIKTYRRMYSLLRIPKGFATILIVLDSGRVENLAEE